MYVPANFPLTINSYLIKTGEENYYKKDEVNYDKYFKDGDVDRNPLTEFNSNNTELIASKMRVLSWVH